MRRNCKWKYKHTLSQFDIKKQQNKKSIMTDKVIGIVGCGAVAEKYHIPAIKDIFDDGSVILVDVNEKRLKEVSQKFGLTRTSTSFKSIVTQLDAAVITTPNSTHYKLASIGIDNGLDLLVEKPLTINRSNAAQLIRNAETRDCTITVNHDRRLYPSHIELKKLLASRNERDEIHTITVQEGGQFGWPAQSKGYFSQNGGGILMDRGPHVLDEICWWLGEKPKLVSYQHDAYGGVEATAEIILRSSDNIKCRVFLSWLTMQSNTIKFVGDNVIYECEPSDWGRYWKKTNGGKKTVVHCKNELVDKIGVIKNLYKNFISCIENENSPMITAKSTLPSIELLNECKKKKRKFESPWLNVKE